MSGVRESRQKPSMHDLYMKHLLTYDEIDAGSGVSKGTTYAMVERRPVSRQVAEKVLTYLNERYKQTYSLDTLDVPLLEDTDAP